jgi:hypothetical protein
MRIIYIDHKDPKLTISSRGEVRVKLNINIDKKLEQEILSFFSKIVDKVGPVEKSLRGKLLFGSKDFVLYTDSRKESVTFSNELFKVNGLVCN